MLHALARQLVTQQAVPKERKLTADNGKLITFCMKLTRAQLHDLYYYLRLNRRVDEQLTHLYRQGKVVGGVYSSLGQEAISVGTACALEPQDFIGPMIRNA